MFSIVNRYRKGFIFLVSIIAIAGIAFYFRMPVSLFPDITFPRIVVLVNNGEQPAERMMIEITRPLEEAVNSVPGVTLVRSKTSRGSAEISINLKWGVDVLQSMQTIQGRISGIRSTLPASASVQIQQMNVTIYPIQGYSLTSEVMSQADLHDLALYQIRPILLRVPGIANVIVTGGDSLEYRVVVDPAKLESFGIDITQVTSVLQKTNIIESAGLVNNSYYLFLALVSGILPSISAIDSVVVAVKNKVPIRLNQVARVSTGSATSYIRTTANGKPAVLTNIIKQPTSSTVSIGKEITAALTKLHLPAQVTISNFYDQSDFIARSIANTRDSILIGILLAMLVLLFFLGSWHIALVLAIVVPATICATIICLHGTGRTINIMTLGGIAASVGLIIDDAIVVIENMFTRFPESRRLFSRGLPAFSHAATISIREMMPAIAGSTMSTIVIQIPLLFLSGITGAFFRPLSITMIFALIISFVFSITLAPLIASRVIREKDIARESAKEGRRGRIAQWYSRSLHFLLDHSWYVIPGAIIILIGTFLLYRHIDSEFMPRMDEGSFVLDYNAPPGTTLDETNRMLNDVEQILVRMPEVESYSRRTGTQLGFFITEPNSGDFLIKLKHHHHRNIEQVISEVRSRVQKIQPSLKIDFGQLLMDVIGDLVNGPAPVEIKIFGEDAQVLRTKAQEIATVISTVPGVVDVSNGITISGPSFVIRPEPVKTALAGLTVSDVYDQMTTYMEGTVASQVQHGERLLDIRVLYPAQYHNDFTTIKNATIINPAGTPIPLSSIATFEMTSGQAQIDREGLRQMLAVTARIEGRDLGHTIADIKKKLAYKIVLPQGVTLTYGGLYQTQQESFQGLLAVAISAIALVFLVMLFEFKEFAVPISVLTITILSLQGVFLALFITKTTFNISSFVGIILIIGIVTENAIFVIHALNIVRTKQQLSLEDSLVEACLQRARPILMTTLGAVLAFLPLALAIGSGAQMEQPLAIAIIGGFSVSSLLLFFGLPVLYRFFHFSSN